MVYIREHRINGRVYYSLVRSVRNGEKVLQERIQWFGSRLPDDVKERLKTAKTIYQKQKLSTTMLKERRSNAVSKPNTENINKTC